MGRIDPEIRMTIKTLAAKGTSCAEIGRLLKLPESNVRYHLARLKREVIDGRSQRPRRALVVAEAIEHWMQTHRDRATNLTVLHDWLLAEHGYTGSLRSVQRYVADRYGPPPRRARRRVETPPGAQAQVDWAIFPGVAVGGRRVDLNALLLNLSFSRFAVMTWSFRRDQLAWIAGHNAAFRRLCGVPAVVRIDNDAAAVARGAGPWGVVSEPYRRYALTMRFHIDLCLPRQPQAKGKVERRVRSHRQCIDPYREHWRDIAQLQAHTDDRLLHDASRRVCPATGTTVAEAFAQEQPLLGALPPSLPEPFDTVATRTVSADALIGFEGRQYSVPFAYIGQRVEARGCAGKGKRSNRDVLPGMMSTGYLAHSTNEEARRGDGCGEECQSAQAPRRERMAATDRRAAAKRT
ncbi:MAG: IS21 family transposase, partial [Vicinamibacterales bacterium]